MDDPFDDFVNGMNWGGFGTDPHDITPEEAAMLCDRARQLMGVLFPHAFELLTNDDNAPTRKMLLTLLITVVNDPRVIGLMLIDKELASGLQVAMQAAYLAGREGIDELTSDLD